MRRYVQVDVGVYDFFARNSDLWSTACGTGPRSRSKLHCPRLFSLLTFHHVLSADTTFRYASRSKFLSIGSVITVEGVSQQVGGWGGKRGLRSRRLASQFMIGLTTAICRL